MSPSENHLLRIRQDNVWWREVDGEVIALDLDSSTYFTTNKTGTMLWRPLVEGATLRDLVHLIETRFDVSAEVATGDVRTFLDLLKANGLLAPT